MGNRFATLTQYHTLVKAHGVMAAMVFLIIVPFAVMTARFYRGSVGLAVAYHAMGHVVAGLMLLAIFILGYFCVGPERSLTNPHHGIGVAIFVMFILQLVGGRLIKNIGKARSFRRMVHQWSGRLISLLGIIQVPLGLTLYGSPKFTFILFALWMTFLLLTYFILEFKRQGRVRPSREAYLSGGRSDGHSRVTESEYTRHHDDESSRSGGGKFKLLAPLAAGAGIFAFLRRKKNKEAKSVSRTRSRSRSRARSRSRSPEVVPSRRGSESFIDDEKYTEVTERPKKSGFMGKLLGVGAALGAAKVVSGLMGRKDRRREDEYSAVSTETPSRLHPPRRRAETVSEFSESSDYPRRLRRHEPPGHSTLLAQSLSAAGRRPGADSEPVTPPRPIHSRTRSGYTIEDSDRYESPSRRTSGKRGGVGKGILAGLGMGWLAKKMAGRKNRHGDEEDDESIREEEDRRSGLHGSRYTGDGHPSPTRSSRRHSRRPSRQPTMGRVTTASNIMSEGDSSVVEPWPHGGTGPPMPPYGSGMPPMPSGPPGPPPAPPMPLPGRSSRSHSHSRHDIDTAQMPPAHHDPRSSDQPASPDRIQRTDSSRRRRQGEEAMAAAAASAGALAAEVEQRRRMEQREREREREMERTPSRQPARTTVRMTVHDDRINLRRLTDEEAAMTRREQRRRRGDSVSSSGADTPSRRYRRESKERRAEAAAERATAEGSDLAPPNPAFAAGSRRAKDSAYYSGQAGPSGAGPAVSTPPDHGQLSALDSDRSHGTWSGMGSPSPSGAMDRPTGSATADTNRRRRRLERNASRPTGADMYD